MKTTHTLRSTSTITPELIGHYQQLLILRHDDKDRLDDHDGFGNRVMAYPNSHPFVVRFEQNQSARVSVAYLSVVDGITQWRYSQWDPGYLRSPVVNDPEAIRMLDEIFMLYYRKNRLPDSLMENPHCSIRLERLNSWFFTQEGQVDYSFVIEGGILASLSYLNNPWEFVEDVRETLGVDAHLIRLRSGKGAMQRERILAIHVNRQVRYIDVGMTGNLYLHLLLSLNELLHPQYEIRLLRKGEGSTVQGGILATLSLWDWHQLEAMHGRELVDGRFERLTAHSQIAIPTNDRGGEILAYDKKSGL